MEIDVMREWKGKLTSHLTGTPGFHSVKLEGKRLRILLDDDTSDVRNTVMDIMERCHADRVPFTFVMVPKVIALGDR